MNTPTSSPIRICHMFDGTIRALSRSASGAQIHADGRTLEEAIGRLILQNGAAFQMPTIGYDMNHEFTRHKVATSFVKPIIYDSSTGR